MLSVSCLNFLFDFLKSCNSLNFCKWADHVFHTCDREAGKIEKKIHVLPFPLYRIKSIYMCHGCVIFLLFLFWKEKSTLHDMNKWWIDQINVLLLETAWTRFLSYYIWVMINLGIWVDFIKKKRKSYIDASHTHINTHTNIYTVYKYLTVSQNLKKASNVTLWPSALQVLRAKRFRLVSPEQHQVWHTYWQVMSSLCGFVCLFVCLPFDVSLNTVSLKTTALGKASSITLVSNENPADHLPKSHQAKSRGCRCL